MIRRRFLELIAFGGAGTLAATGLLETGETKTVTYKIRGFTCVTCATGLEVMLQREKGVLWAKASYPDAVVTIKYHPASVSEDSLKTFISEMGFTATKENHG